MIGGVAVREAPDSMFYILPANGSNVTDVVDVVARDARRVQVAVVLTTMVGIIQVSLKKQNPHPRHTTESCCGSCISAVGPHRVSVIWLKRHSKVIQLSEVFSRSKITVYPNDA